MCLAPSHSAAAYLQSLPTLPPSSPLSSLPPPPWRLPRCCSLLFCVINFRFSGNHSCSSLPTPLPPSEQNSISFSFHMSYFGALVKLFLLEPVRTLLHNTFIILGLRLQVSLMPNRPIWYPGAWMWVKIEEIANTEAMVRSC